MLLKQEGSSYLSQSKITFVADILCDVTAQEIISYTRNCPELLVMVVYRFYSSA